MTRRGQIRRVDIFELFNFVKVPRCRFAGSDTHPQTPTRMVKKYSREVIQQKMKLSGISRDTCGTLSLFLPLFQTAIEFQIQLAHQDTVLPKSVATINDIVGMSETAFRRLLQLLHADAMRTRKEVSFGDPDVLQQPTPRGFFARMFKQKHPLQIVMIDQNDPRHPCFFEHGLASVETRVEWLGVRINEHIGTRTRLCVLDCRPRWEEEHGASIVFRDGIPLALVAYDVLVDEFDLA